MKKKNIKAVKCVNFYFPPTNLKIMRKVRNILHGRTTMRQLNLKNLDIWYATEKG